MPPKSGVRGPGLASKLATADSIAAAAASSWRWSSINPAERIAASGLAIPCPVMSGAEPWTGSNILGDRRVGSMLALEASPMLPTTIAARSVKISPNKLLATTTSNVSGRRNKLHHRTVDQQRVGFDLRELAGDFCEDFVPQHHSIALGIAFGGRGDMFLGARLCFFESGPDNAFAAAPGEHGRLDGDVVGLVLVDPAANVGVLPFGIFAIDEHVDRVGRFVTQGAFDSRVEARRAEANKLIEPPANRQQQAVEGDVVLYVGVSHGTQQDGIVAGQLVKVIVAGHLAMLKVVVASPRVVGPLERGAGQFCGRFDCADGLAGYFRADAVSFDNCDVKRCHGGGVFVAGGWGNDTVAVTVRSRGEITEKNIGRFLERRTGSSKCKLKRKLIFWKKPSSCAAGATLSVLTCSARR